MTPQIATIIGLVIMFIVATAMPINNWCAVMMTLCSENSGIAGNGGIPGTVATVIASAAPKRMRTGTFWLPITAMVNALALGKIALNDAIGQLMSRPLKQE